MGEIRNMTEENAEALRAELEEMKIDNPGLEYRMWEQNKKELLGKLSEEKDEQPSNKAIFEKMEAIERKLDLIFGGHVLIDGLWTKTQ